MVEKEREKVTDVNNSYIYTPGFPTYPNYQTYWYGPRVTKTVVVEKFYDAEGRLVREVTTTTESPYGTTYGTTAGAINVQGGNSNIITYETNDSTTVAEPKVGKHRKKG